MLDSFTDWHPDRSKSHVRHSFGYIYTLQTSYMAKMTVYVLTLLRHHGRPKDFLSLRYKYSIFRHAVVVFHKHFHTAGTVSKSPILSSLWHIDFHLLLNISYAIFVPFMLENLLHGRPVRYGPV